MNKQQLMEDIKNFLLYNYKILMAISLNYFCKLIKQLTTTANVAKVPVHKNQKQLILKNSNQPNFDKKLIFLLHLKI